VPALGLSGRIPPRPPSPAVHSHKAAACFKVS
jgi:hypothetical protein